MKCLTGLAGAGVRRMRVASLIAVLLAATHVLLAATHDVSSMLVALPQPFRSQLDRYHATCKQNGGDSKWTPEEDAAILWQLKLGPDPVSQRNLSIPNRSVNAARLRYKTYLKPHVYDPALAASTQVAADLCQGCEPAMEDQHLRDRLERCGVHLREDVQDALVRFHFHHEHN